MKRGVWFLLVLLFTFSSGLLAAEDIGKLPGIVQGRVTDDRGYLIPGVSVTVLETGDRVYSDIQGEYLLSLRPGQYTFLYDHDLLITEERNVYVIGNRLLVNNIELDSYDNSDLFLTRFEEDSLIGAYFLGKDKLNFDPELYQVIIEKYQNDNSPEALIKTILAEYILSQSFDVMKYISQERLERNLYQVVPEAFDVDSEKKKIELSIIKYFREDINQKYNKLMELTNGDFAYRFFHIELTEKNSEKMSNSKTNQILYKYSGVFNSLFFPLESELSGSIETMDLINNMLPMSYKKLIAYKDSPLVSMSFSQETLFRKVEVKEIVIDKNDLGQINKFFNLFLDNYYVLNKSVSYKDSWQLWCDRR